MKKTQTLLGLLFIVAMTWSCSKNDNGDTNDYSSLIIGTWKASSITYSSYINDIKQSEASTDEEDLADYFITFNADGSAEYEGDDPVTYKVEGDQLTIYESEAADDTDVFNIVSITKTQLVLQTSSEQTSNGNTYKNVEEDILTRVE